VTPTSSLQSPAATRHAAPRAAERPQDLEQEAGSWSLANREMDRALTWAGWDARAVFGKGFHTPRPRQRHLPGQPALAVA